jgi:histidinol-phosphate/aromatic aminotransferase/cobyric acid decarboxylase-like protein
VTRDLLTLNRNEFLFDHSPGVKSALLQAADLSHYAVQSLRNQFQLELGEFLNIDATQLALGHGAEDLLLKLMLHYRRFRSCLVLPSLSWGEYLRMGQSLEYDLAQTKMDQETLQSEAQLPARRSSLCIDLNDIAAQLATRQPQDCVVLIPTTNNPTGSRIAEFQLKHVLQAFPQALFILDAVYEPLPSRLFHEFSEHPNVHVVGSMSKFFGLPGLRLGFCSGKLPPAFHMALGHGSWQLEVARAAMRDCAAYTQARALMTETAQRLADLKLSNVTVFASCAPFVLARVNDGLSDPFPSGGRAEHDLRDLVNQCTKSLGILPKAFIHEDALWLRFGLGPQPIGERVEQFLQLLDIALDRQSANTKSCEAGLQETRS